MSHQGKKDKIASKKERQRETEVNTETQTEAVIKAEVRRVREIKRGTDFGRGDGRPRKTKQKSTLYMCSVSEQRVLVEETEESVISALSAECPKARVGHYTDRVCSHDSDSQEPPRSTGHLSNPIPSPPNGQTEWKWGMTINAISGSLQQQVHRKGHACHWKGVTGVRGRRDNQQPHHPGAVQHMDGIRQRLSISPLLMLI